MMTIRFRMVPIIPSIAKTLSSLLSFSWPPLSSSFPLVITILVANVFIFLPRLTEQRIRRRAGGARGTQQSHSPARARGAGVGERRRGGRGEERRGCHRLLPHSLGQRRSAGRRRLGLAAGRRTPCARLMSPSAAGEVCAPPGCLRAAPRGSSCPAPGSAGGSGATATATVGRPPCGAQSCARRLERSKGLAASGSLQGTGTSAAGGSG